MNKKVIMIMTLGALLASAQASLVWQGGGGLFDEPNWLDDDGNQPAADTINGGSAISANTGIEKLVDISLANAINYWNNLHVGNNSLNVAGGITLSAAAGQISLGKGQLVTVYNGINQNLTISQGATVSVGRVANFNSIALDNGTLAIVNEVAVSGAKAEQITLKNGSLLSAISLNSNYSVSVDETSAMSLTHASTPFGSIDLALGGELTLASAGLFTTKAADIFVNGVSYADDSSILSFVGTTATAIPEPAVIGLIAMMGGGTLFIRRRFMP